MYVCVCLQNLKQKLIEQPEVDKSPSRNSNPSPVKQTSIPVGDPTEPVCLHIANERVSVWMWMCTCVCVCACTCVCVHWTKL